MSRLSTGISSASPALAGTGGTDARKTRLQRKKADSVAYIIDDQVLTKSETRCALSRASFDRQRDIFKLAGMGNASCRRLWDEFAREEPGNARLVMADVNADKALAVKANRHLDKVLGKSEKPKVKKSRKPAPELTEREKFLRAALNSPNPAEREAARSELGI